MEGLIIFAVMALLSLLFSGEKKNKSTSPKGQSSGRFGDFMTQMKEKMEQIEAETQPLSKRQQQAKKVAQQAKRRAQQLAEQKERPYDETLEKLAEETYTQATTPPEKVRVKSMQQMRQEAQPVQRVKKRHPLLATKSDAQRAILLAEVLGPPKSKRK